jgi:hypothetical protein
MSEVQSKGDVATAAGGIRTRGEPKDLELGHERPEDRMVSEKLLREVGDLVNQFIYEQRHDSHSKGSELPTALLDRYSPLFENEEVALGKARVVFVDRLADPIDLNKFLIQHQLPEMRFSAYLGMTFVDTIVLSRVALGVSGFGQIEKDERMKPDLTLFHELVHVIQYQALRVDPTEPASIDLFTKWQVPGYFQMWGKDGERIAYADIAFEDAATVAESAYEGKPDGIEVAYRFMRARGIPFHEV